MPVFSPSIIPNTWYYANWLPSKPKWILWMVSQNCPSNLCLLILVFSSQISLQFTYSDKITNPAFMPGITGTRFFLGRLHRQTLSELPLQILPDNFSPISTLPESGAVYFLRCLAWFVWNKKVAASNRRSESITTSRLILASFKQHSLVKQRHGFINDGAVRTSLCFRAQSAIILKLAYP